MRQVRGRLYIATLSTLLACLGCGGGTSEYKGPKNAPGESDIEKAIKKSQDEAKAKQGEGVKMIYPTSPF